MPPKSPSKSKTKSPGKEKAVTFPKVELGVQIGDKRSTSAVRNRKHAKSEDDHSLEASLLDVNQKLSALPVPSKSSDTQQMSPKSPKFLATADVVDPCFHFAYVGDGYRTNYEVWDACVSVFEMHNETLNIWSHLLGFFSVVLVGLIYLTDDVQKDLDSEELFYFAVYLVSASICLLFSAVFHWFCCLSPVVYDKLLVLDLSGVALLVAGSYFPAVYYGFYCEKNLQFYHICLAWFVLVMGLVSPWITYTINGALIRPYILASLGVLGICPFINWMLITPAIARDDLAGGYYLVFLLYGLGFWFWWSKYPEKMFPKSYLATHWVSSHTLWHLCVVAAVFWWFRHIHNSRLFFKNQVYGKCIAYEDEQYSKDTLLNYIKTFL